MATQQVQCTNIKFTGHDGTNWYYGTSSTAWKSTSYNTNGGLPCFGHQGNYLRALIIQFTTPTFPSGSTNKKIHFTFPIWRGDTSYTTAYAGSIDFRWRALATGPSLSSQSATQYLNSTSYLTENIETKNIGNTYTSQTFTINASNLNSNTTYYLAIYANSYIENKTRVGCMANNFQYANNYEQLNVLAEYTTSSSTTTTYTYDCYDTTNNTWIDSETYETDTTATSITRPTITGYTYTGYSVGSSWSTSGVQYTGTTCTQHNASNRIIIFYYTKNSSGGGGGSVTPTSWSWNGSYATKLGSMQNGGNTSFSFNLSTGKVGYCPFSPDVNGTITVYTTGSDDTYGYLVDADNATLYTSAGYGSQLFYDNHSNVYTDDDDSGDDSNFSYTYDVTANTAYNIIFAGYDGLSESVSGTLFFTFTPSITTWQTPVRIASISGSSYTTYSTTSTVNKYNAGYVQYTTPSYAGKIVFETTSESTSPDYISYLSTSELSKGSGTNRYTAVTGAILEDDDDGGAEGYDTLISYECNASTIYYWYVNSDWANSGTYSIPWKLNYYRKYTITYNANNGTGAPSAQSFYADNTTVSISNTTPTRSNYIFLGWSTNASATSATYTAGSSQTLSTQNYTLYAIWEPIKYYITVKYHTNDGSNNIFATKDYNSTATGVPFNIITDIPTRDKYEFLGWGTYELDTTPDYQPGTKNLTYQGNSSSENPAICNLYAVWKKKGNIYYCINDKWLLCETYIYKNEKWESCQFSYSPEGTSWEQ